MDAALKVAIKKLAAPDFGKFCFWLVFDVTALVVLLITSGFVPFYLLPLFILAIGVFQHRLALIGHDLCHVRFFKNRFFNMLALEVIGQSIFITGFDGYREYHLDHHSHVGSEHDPELSYRKGWGHSISLKKILIGFVGDLFGLGIVSLFRFLLDVFPTTVGSRCRLVGGWVLIVSIAWLLGGLFYVGIWVISLLTTFWAVFRVRAYLEHVGVADHGKHTSHRFFTNGLLKPIFFPHNTWCHYEHHLFPTIPFHNLPQLRELLKSDEYKSIRPLKEAILNPQ